MTMELRVADVHVHPNPCALLDTPLTVELDFHVGGDADAEVREGDRCYWRLTFVVDMTNARVPVEVRR